MVGSGILNFNSVVEKFEKKYFQGVIENEYLKSATLLVLQNPFPLSPTITSSSLDSFPARMCYQLHDAYIT